MLIRSILFASIICLFAHLASAQENRLLIVHKDQSTTALRKGDYVRLAYPSSKLNLDKKKQFAAVMGFRGHIDSISTDEIWLRVDKRTKKQLSFKVENIFAIKKVSKSSELLTFAGSFLVIGGAAVIATSIADVNPALVAFSGAFSVFPAAIITANVFYPSKPHKKVGEDYTLKIITLN